MLFNSLIFLVFFGITYAAYLVFQKHYKIQNLLLLVASYIFYGWWDWRFLSLLFITTVIDYVIGIKLDATSNPRHRKALVTASVCANLSILGFFKYFNFFSENFIKVLNLFGMQADDVTLKIILPVGISFYTFQTMSYTIDIYREKLKPTKSFLDFALFVSFFPQLVAGPIERALHLLPQISTRRHLKSGEIDAGLFLILWGYFKKVVVADRMALIANSVFNNYTDYSGLDLWIGILAFTFQIYGDFSGYSDIARGLSKLMGFDLMVNFKLPYFAKNPSDFWARWHISLSSWLRDYLYIPLGGNRGAHSKTLRNLMLTMVIGGLWHGASWNFVIWGTFHGAILVLYRVLAPVGSSSIERTWQRYSKIAFMFLLTIIGWLIFRAHSAEQIWYFLSHMHLTVSEHSFGFLKRLIAFSSPLILVQWLQHKSKDLIILTKYSIPLRVMIYSGMLAGIFTLGVRESIEFIYFQF